MIPPFDMVIEPESEPAAPAFLGLLAHHSQSIVQRKHTESPEPGADPASPGAGSPLCNGVAVARAAKNEETELEDISGVNDTNEVVAAAELEVMGLEDKEEISGVAEISCAETCVEVMKKEKFNSKLKGRRARIFELNGRVK